MKGTVLLVEDEDDARGSLQRAFARAGWTCLAAADLKAATVHLDARTFLDVAVTDVVLGDDERGGLNLIPLLRAREVHAPVVVITAFADVERVKTALNAGAAYLLEKPFSAADLLTVVDRVVAERSDLNHRVDRALHGAGLTEKEMGVARLLLKGLTSQEIARLENNSDKTIRQHTTQIYLKLGVENRSEFFHFVFPS